jgi:hypothetical protein
VQLYIGFFSEYIVKFILEVKRHRFLSLHNPFKRRKQNESKIRDDTLYGCNESLFQMNGRLVFDTRILLETIIKDQNSKQIRTDSLQEIAESYHCNGPIKDKSKELDHELSRKMLYSCDELPSYFNDFITLASKKIPHSTKGAGVEQSYIPKNDEKEIEEENDEENENEKTRITQRTKMLDRIENANIAAEAIERSNNSNEEQEKMLHSFIDIENQSDR